MYIELGLESIDYQSHGKYSELEDTFSKIKEDVLLNNYNNYQVEKKYSKGLNGLLKKLFGLRCDVSFKNNRNMMAYPLMVNKQHTLASVRKILKRKEYFHERVDSSINQLKIHGGTVDTANAVVGGAFSTHENKIAGDIVFFLKRFKFTPGMVTAVFLHEVGHLFHMCEYADRTHDINIALRDASQRKMGHKGATIKYLFQDSVDDGLLKKEALSEVLDYKGTNKYVLSWKLTDALTNDLLSSMPIPKYSEISNERLADNFATRCGYGTDLARALDTWVPEVNIRFTSAMILTYTQMMANVIFMVLAFGINPFFGILIASIIFYRAIKSYTTSGLNFTYDSDMGRIRAVREDTISRLKDMNVSSDERQRLISSYDDIEEMLNIRREYDSLVNMILDHLVPGQLKIKNDILFQKELEGIVNNPLYASAIRTLED